MTQIETLGRLLEAYGEDEHDSLMLGPGVDMLPTKAAFAAMGADPSFEGAKQLLARMLGSHFPDEEKLKLLLGLAIEETKQTLQQLHEAWN